MAWPCPANRRSTTCVALSNWRTRVVDEAADASEGWLSLLPDAAEATPLQRAVNDLARNLRMRHFDGDGCIDH